MHGDINSRLLHGLERILDSLCMMSPINFLLTCLKAIKWDFWVLGHVFLDGSVPEAHICDRISGSLRNERYGHILWSGRVCSVTNPPPPGWYDHARIIFTVCFPHKSVSDSKTGTTLNVQMSWELQTHCSLRQQASRHICSWHMIVELRNKSCVKQLIIKIIKKKVPKCTEGLNKRVTQILTAHMKLTSKVAEQVDLNGSWPVHQTLCLNATLTLQNKSREE